MSVPDSIQPSTKRKRRDSDSGLQNELSFKNIQIPRSKDFWYKDGSVILYVENTLFRVHRTILAEKSDSFQDIFTSADIQNYPVVKGCPVVTCSEDSAKDWTNVFMFIYHFTKLEHYGPAIDVQFIASMLRLGQKYKMDLIVRDGMARLDKEVPRHCKNERWWTWNNIEDLVILINLGQELGIKSILPACYFACISTWTTEQIFDGFVKRLENGVAPLSIETRKLLLVARDKVVLAYRMHAIGWIMKFHDFSRDCPNGESCSKVVELAIAFCEPRFMQFPRPDDEEWQLDSSLKGLCVKCTAQATFERTMEMNSLWDKLPSLFDLSTQWDNLDDETHWSWYLL